MKKRFLRLTSLLAMMAFFMVSYVEATATDDVSLPVDVGGMEKYGYDFTGFSMDKESLLTMMDASIKGLNKAIKECEDEARKSELSGRVEALSRAYEVVSASDKENYYLTDEDGNLITGSGSLYKILGYMRGGVESLEIEADWDMTPREIVISGNGNSALVYYKDGKFYSDKEAETEIFSIDDVGGRIIVSDSQSGHYKGVYSESGLEVVGNDGRFIMDDEHASVYESDLRFSADADYYWHLQVIRSDSSDEVKEGPIDVYFDDNALYRDFDFSDRADSIDIPSSDDYDEWKLIDIITDVYGESYVYSLVELRPVIGERVTDIEIIEDEDDSDDGDSDDGSDGSDSGDAADGSGDGTGSGSEGGDDSDGEHEFSAEVIVHTENYLAGYVAENSDGDALFVVSADGSIDYDNTEIDAEEVDVEQVKAEALANWLEEKEAQRRAEEEEEEEEMAAIEASSGMSLEDAAAVASSDEAGLASSSESDEAAEAASEASTNELSDSATEGMAGDEVGNGDAIGSGEGDGIVDAAGAGGAGEGLGEGGNDGNEEALAGDGGNDGGGDDNEDEIAGGDDGNGGEDASDSGDSGDDSSGDGSDDSSGDGSDDGDDGDGESISEDAAPSEEYHGDVEASDNSDGDDDSE